MSGWGRAPGGEMGVQGKVRRGRGVVNVPEDLPPSDN